MFKRSAIVCALACAALHSASPLGAAAQFQFTPSFGIYLPHGVALLQEPGIAANDVVKKQAVGGPVFTTRAALWLSRMAALEASVSYSPALIAVHSASGHVEDVSAGLVLASVRSVFRLTPESSTRFSIHAASGVGLVNRSGSAWSDTPAKPAFALVVAGGARVPLTPRSGLAFRFDLEDYLSWAQFKLEDGTRSKAHPYHDLVWSFGLAIPLSRSHR